MPGPFPGVDPFLESQHYWQDFHTRFVNYWCEAISDALPDHYEARLDERVQIVEFETHGSRVILPNVAVVQKPVEESAAPRKGGMATLEAVTMELPIMAEVRHTWVEILHRPERNLVAVLELLSPTNKTSPGRGPYLAKRSDLFTQPVHLVELDFLLGGERLPMRRPLPPGDFYAIVSRAQPGRKGDVYAWSLQSQLPLIPVPLRKPDNDIHVDLAAVFTTAYDRGKFRRSIDYSAPLDGLPLNQSARKWAEQIGKPA
jgi:hypothetical protein